MTNNENKKSTLKS